MKQLPARTVSGRGPKPPAKPQNKRKYRRFKDEKEECKGLTVWGAPCKMPVEMDGYCRFHNPHKTCAAYVGRRRCPYTPLDGTRFCSRHAELGTQPPPPQEIVPHKNELPDPYLIPTPPIISAPPVIPAAKVQEPLPSFLSYLPDSLAERAAKMEKDPQLSNLRYDLILLSTRLTQLLENMSNPATNYHKMLEIVKYLTRAYDAVDTREVRKHLDNLIGAINDGLDQRAAWDEVYEIIDRRQRAIVAERKQVTEDGGFMSVQEVFGIMSLIMTSVATHVPEKERLDAIRKDIARMVQLGPIVESESHEISLGR